MKKIRKSILTVITTLALSLTTVAGVAYQSFDKELFEASAASIYTTSNGNDYRVERVLGGSPDSFEAWINIPTNSTGGTIAGNAHVDYSQSTSYSYDTTNWEITDAGLFRVDWDDGAVSHVFTGTPSLKDGNWHHVACVRSSTGFTYYLDGVVAGTLAVSTNPLYSPSPIIIGADQTTWKGRKTPLVGFVRQVAIYEGAITQEQVTADMKKTALTKDDCISTGAKLMGNWYLGETWTKEVVENSVLDGPDVRLGTHEKYVAGSLPDASTYDYSFAVIPDIQQMTRYVPERLHTQMKWIADNAESNKLKFAMQLGDLADIGYVEWEYMNASKAMSQLNGKVPYCFVPGNHDYTNLLDHSRDTEFLNKWFPVETPSAAYTGYYTSATTDATTIANNPDGRWDNDHVRYFYGWKTDVSEYNKPMGMSDLPGFGGVYEAGESANSYYVFETGVAGVEYLVINLEYQPRKSVLRWASRIIDKHPHHRVIINSHNIIDPDGDFNKSYTRYHGDTTPAQGVYDYLISQHSNVFLSFSGHECFDDILINKQTGVNGNVVRSMLVDTQVAWDPNETASIAATSAYSNRTKTSEFRNKQDMFAMVYVNETEKTMTVRFLSPENMNRGENAFWNLQNQFTFSFADEKNPAIGGVETDIEGTVKNLVDGKISGATVEVEDLDISAVTAADGTFTLKNVPADKEITLIVSKNGYETSKTVLSADELTAEKTTLDAVNLGSIYAQTGAFATKYTNLSAKVGRTIDGVEFKFTGKNLLAGAIEVYFDTKDCASHRDQDSSMWRFDLYGSYADVVPMPNTTTPSEATIESLIRYTVTKNDSNGFEASLFIPYEAVGMNAADIFGLSLGQYAIVGWDGWVYDDTYVAPEYPKQFMRLSTKNELFTAQSNAGVPVTLSGVVYDVDGITPKSGVTVSAAGVTATTGANGSWSMTIAKPIADVEVVYSAPGYFVSTATVSKSNFESSSSYSLNKTINPITYVSLGGTIAAAKASWTPYVARTENTVEFKFVANNAFNGWFELFIDTGESTSARTVGDYKINLESNGVVNPMAYDASVREQVIDSNGMTYNLVTEGGKTVIYLSITYTSLGIEKTATIGVSAGQSDNGWDGWGNDTYIGSNGIGFVAPEIPTDYIRVGYDGTTTRVFWSENNVASN